jgi:hypothetical protein
VAPASQGLLARIQRANDDAALRFGPNTAEVEAFINAAAQLTPWQWRQVLATKRLVSSVTKEGSGEVAGTARSIQASIRSSETHISEPMARAGEVLFDALAKRSEEKQVAAWQAMSALVMRSKLPSLKFAVHYAPFASAIPVSGSDVLEPKTLHFIARVEALTPEQCDILARRWRIEAGASRALLQAVAKNREVKSEEAVALAALAFIPSQLAGDAGWSAVRTVVHGGRVLACLSHLSAEEVAENWVPLEGVIPLRSLNESDSLPAVERVAAAVMGGIKTLKSRRRSSRIAPTTPPKAPAPYGQNSTEVAAFIKGVAELTPIQWLRVLDRRKLVESVTREGNAEPSSVVRSILAAIDGSRELDMFTRCRVFAAVERAGYAAESRGRLRPDQVEQMYRPFAGTIPVSEISGNGFVQSIASLGKHDWQRVAAASPDANEEAVGPLVNAGSALIDFVGGRSDDEAVAIWHAVSALVRRYHLTPIKFAASYAPFASAIPVTNPRALGAMVSRYVTALGRLSAGQCAVLAQPSQVDDEASNVLSKVVADGSPRTAEEAAALTAVVTVPMRLAGSKGWAAVKTAAYGGRVIASRTKLTPQQLEALWKPIEAAIPLVALGAPAKTRR